MMQETSLLMLILNKNLLKKLQTAFLNMELN